MTKQLLQRCQNRNKYLKNKTKPNEKSLAIIFANMGKTNSNRKKVTHNDVISKMTLIINKSKNQCYSIAAFQMLLGITELWADIMEQNNKEKL